MSLLVGSSTPAIAGAFHTAGPALELTCVVLIHAANDAVPPRTFAKFVWVSTPDCEVAESATNGGDALAVQPVVVVKPPVFDADATGQIPRLCVNRKTPGPVLVPTPTFQSFHAISPRQSLSVHHQDSGDRRQVRWFREPASAGRLKPECEAAAVYH